MSYDQRPSRIKLVSAGGPAPAPEGTAAPQGTTVTASVGEGASADAGSEAKDARGSTLAWASLFCLGCAIGGAGLAAWPHLAG